MTSPLALHPNILKSPGSSESGSTASRAGHQPGDNRLFPPSELELPPARNVEQ